MAEHFADRLVRAVRERGNPICVGLDPVYDQLPPGFIEEGEPGEPLECAAAVDAISQFCVEVVRLLAGRVPAVKINSAFFERYYWEGVEAYYSLILEAAERGLIVIGDVKRGDVGSTAEQYAQAHVGDPASVQLGEFRAPDAVTVNPFFGDDGLLPFLELARTQGRGLFVLCRTSNPSAGQVQDLTDASGKKLWEHLAERVAAFCEDATLVSESGYGDVGIVVGGTSPDVLGQLRQRHERLWLLVPGYGAQGAKAEDCVRALKEDGTGGLISASRSIIQAWRDPRYTEQFHADWKACIVQAVLDMQQDLQSALAGGSPA